MPGVLEAKRSCEDLRRRIDRLEAAAKQIAPCVVVIGGPRREQLLELSDRLVVISEGRIVHETATAVADITVVGHAMAGGAHAQAG